MNELILVYPAIFVLGLLLGSYLNSWMWRVHEGRWRLGGRSVCIHCNRTLAWYENVPLASFVWLRGQCRTCHGIIPVSYFGTELATGLALVWLLYFCSTGTPDAYWLFLRNIFFVVLLIVVFVYDAKYGLILSGVTWAGGLLGAWFNIAKLGYTWQSLALGVAVGSGFFLLQYAISRGRWIGGGDVRLGGMMGAWLGWPTVGVALFISYMLGALVAVPLLVMRRKQFESEIPFGTFLAVGTFISLFWGGALLERYVHLIGW